MTPTERVKSTIVRIECEDSCCGIYVKDQQGTELTDEELVPEKLALQLAAELEQAQSALKVIHTWANFEYGELKRGHALHPDHVASACMKGLGRETPNAGKEK